MNIIGLDALVFGVEDIEACSRYLLDYGLQPTASSGEGGRFEALDGTGVVLVRASDPDLPAPNGPASLLRETIYGVGDEGNNGDPDSAAILHCPNMGDAVHTFHLHQLHIHQD